MIAVTLPTGPQGASAARRLLSAALGEAGCSDELVDRVVLVGSELVTNAVVHGTGAPRLRFSILRDRARLEVYDEAPDLPGMPAPDAAADDTLTSGRGMLIVQRSANRWGTKSQGLGKWVWAEFSAEPPTDAPDPIRSARRPVGARLDALLRTQGSRRATNQQFGPDQFGGSSLASA